MARIAFCSPLPPARTGIATYAAAVLDGFERIGLERRHEVDRVWPVGPDAESRVADADVGIFQLGNNTEFHGPIYRLGVWHPGVTVIHDLALDGLFYGLGLVKDPLVEPARADAIAALPEGSAADGPLGIPWCAQAVRRARAVIVHSRFARDYLERIGCRTPVFVAPHPLVERDQDLEQARPRRDELRSRAGAGPADLLVGVAGDLNASKGIEALLEAVAHVRTSVRVALVGRPSPHWDVRPALKASGVADRVTLVSDVSDDDFLGWLCAVDVLVNLRHPHRGETSGSLVRALHAGLPTIVSAEGTYLEVPEDVVVRVPPGAPDARALAAAIDRLGEDPEARAAIGHRASAWSRRELDPAVTGRVYERAIESVFALRADPARAALARWAGALGAVGVGPRHVRRGYGLRYADALEDLGAAEVGATAARRGRAEVG
jgi:glycosyltransferase involved in cell wall biosynthesis